MNTAIDVCVFLGVFAAVVAFWSLFQTAAVVLVSIRRGGGFKSFDALPEHDKDLIALGVFDDYPLLAWGFDRVGFEAQMSK